MAGFAQDANPVTMEVGASDLQSVLGCAVRLGAQQGCRQKV